MSWHLCGRCDSRGDIVVAYGINWERTVKCPECNGAGEIEESDDEPEAPEPVWESGLVTRDEFRAAHARWSKRFAWFLAAYAVALAWIISRTVRGG